MLNPAMIAAKVISSSLSKSKINNSEPAQETVAYNGL